jgi:DNA-binding MarR family transcriptional regulator
MESSPKHCAAELLETVPHLMRVIRTNVRNQHGPELTMPQFRALAFLGRNRCAMLTDVSAFLGLSLPAASKLVDGLVSTQLASREPHAADRRRISLALTPAGRLKHEAVVQAAREFLARKMRHLKPTERATVWRAMKILHEAFADAPDEEHKRSRAS